MQYFQDPNGKVYALDADVIVTELNGIYSFQSAAGASLDLPASLAPCADNTHPGPTAQQAWAALRAEAQAALDRSDVTMTRILEAVIAGRTSLTAPDVVAWAPYRDALRAIVGAPTGDPTKGLPAAPPYPSGT